MSADATLDLPRARDLFGVPPPTRPRGGGVPPVPDLFACTFDPQLDAFHLVYADWSSQDLARTELADVGTRQVVAWGIDAFRRGVEVALDDGTITSFSAEFPRYLHDRDYRRRVDARRGPAQDDLGQRVATRVRAERERLGWTVAELARAADMAAPNVHRVETGKHVPSMPTVVRLAAALGVPLERLLRHTPA